MVNIELNTLDAPSSVDAGEDFSASVSLVNRDILPPQGIARDPSCGSGILSPAGEEIEVELRIENSLGQTHLSRTERVCAPYAEFVPGIGGKTASFSNLSLPEGGSYNIVIEAEPVVDISGSDTLTESLSVSGTYSGGGGSDSGGSEEEESEADDNDDSSSSEQAKLVGIAGAVIIAVLFIFSSSDASSE